MNLIRELKDSMLHLAFPHICEGCGMELSYIHQQLCLRCLASLPHTYFQFYPANPVEKLFWGRMPVRYATAQYFFTAGSVVRRLMHQFKYKGNKSLGVFLGELMGQGLIQSNRFSEVEVLVPVPLFSERERKRGYNQSVVLGQGIQSALKKPLLDDVVRRTSFEESQTRKQRAERWQNVEGRFKLIKGSGLEGKHVLLIDDVITTGATLEACGKELLAVPNLILSIATLCFSSG